MLGGQSANGHNRAVLAKLLDCVVVLEINVLRSRGNSGVKYTQNSVVTDYVSESNC